MDKAERSTLLRDRFKAVGGLPFVYSGVRKAKSPQSPPRHSKCDEWPQIEVNHKRTPKWAFDPDPKKPMRLTPKRTARISPLIRIAAQYPKRQPRPADRLPQEKILTSPVAPE
jgi:hypothetical protein